MKRSACVGRGFVWVYVTLATMGLGCDDECDKGATECISDSLYRVCIDGEDGPEWLVSQCGDNEVCQSDAAQPGAGGGGGTDAGASAPAGDASGDACVGTCTLDERECVTDGLARFCIAGGIWQLDMCDVGEQCVSGECVLSAEEGRVMRCEPGTKQCASDMVEKVCDPDGTAWIYQGCNANEVCLGDECVADPASSCDDGNSCLDNKTLVRCLGQDMGFELVECAGDTYCQGGVCRGDNCVVGSYCNGVSNGQAQIRECTDGVNLRDVSCEVGEVCRNNPDNSAECVKPACTVGTSVCGDPTDTSVDATQFFSSCVTLPNAGVPGWVRGECVDNLSCDPAFVGGSNPCRQDCTPGAQRCAPLGTVVGINDGWQECDETGVWGPVVRCNPGTETRLLCNIRPTDDPAALPEAVCAAPVCNYAVNFPGSGAEGACEGARIRSCNEDGTLADAENCEVGICRNLATTVTDDGRVPGACDVNIQCREGEERCVESGATPTPRYQTCIGGLWSTRLETCAGDTICRDYIDDTGMSRKVCDADCVPGTRQCAADGIQTCDAMGKWSETEACGLGTCSTLSNGDAACVLPCVPGSTRCAGLSARASDGVHIGTDSEQVCNASGQWEAPTACSGTDVCRTTRSGAVLGCVECLGSDAPGGNSEGLADTRCDGADRTQGCGADNTWEASVACSAGGSCVGPTPATCGACIGPDAVTSVPLCNLTNYGAVEYDCDACIGPDGTTVLSPCTQTNYGAVPYACGSCMGPDGTTNLPTCTQAAYSAVPHSCGGCNLTTTMSGVVALGVCSLTNIDSTESGLTCADTDVGGSPGSWAGVSDCCGGAQLTYGDVTAPSCSPGFWAGTADCCATAQLTYLDNDSSLTCNPAPWAGTADCCESARLGYSDGNPSATLAMCAPSPWAGEAECCLAAQQGGSGPSFAYCQAP